MSTVTAATARETATRYRELNRAVNTAIGTGVKRRLLALREHHAETRRVGLILSSMLLNERCAFNALSQALRFSQQADPGTVGPLFQTWAEDYARTEDYIREMEENDV